MARGAGHLLRRLFPNALGKSPLVNFARRRVQGELLQPTEPITSANDGSMKQQVRRPEPSTSGGEDSSYAS